MRWLTPEPSGDWVLLLGAFDPPTLAHLALADATGAAFCMTEQTLGRPDEPLLGFDVRLGLLVGLGRPVAVAPAGTYLEVARAAGRPVTFVVGSDKLAQLSDPSFYPDGQAGVQATFRECSFLVVRRGPDGPGEHLLSDDLSQVSASRVRERIRAGLPVVDLVPAPVALALASYTGLPRE